MENQYIIHTSGSTGSPKAVMFTHQNLLDVGILDTVAYNLTSKSVMAVERAQGVPMLRRMFDALASGCNLAVYRGRDRESMRHFLLERKVTHLNTLATTCRWICSGLYKFPDVQLIEIGGEMCDWEDIKLMRHCFPNAVHMVRYAASEVHIITRGIIPHEQPLGTGRLPVGVPLEGVEINIVDDKGNVIPDFLTNSKMGEIVVKTPWMATGYWNDPELTAAKFKPLGYFTGDIGYFLPNGWLQHMGRMHFQEEYLKRYNENLTAGERLDRNINKTIGSL